MVFSIFAIRKKNLLISGSFNIRILTVKEVKESEVKESEGKLGFILIVVEIML